MSSMCLSETHRCKNLVLGRTWKADVFLPCHGDIYIYIIFFCWKSSRDHLTSNCKAIDHSVNIYLKSNPPKWEGNGKCNKTSNQVQWTSKTTSVPFLSFRWDILKSLYLKAKLIWALCRFCIGNKLCLSG